MPPMTNNDDDNRPFDGIVHDPSKPSHVLPPPLGMTITDGERAMLVEWYGEQAVDDWHRRKAAFLARRGGEGGESEIDSDSADSDGDSGDGDGENALTEAEEIELLRALGYDI
jgi:hypothetical protein